MCPKQQGHLTAGGVQQVGTKMKSTDWFSETQHQS